MEPRLIKKMIHNLEKLAELNKDNVGVHQQLSKSIANMHKQLVKHEQLSDKYKNLYTSPSNSHQHHPSGLHAKPSYKAELLQKLTKMRVPNEDPNNTLQGTKQPTGKQQASSHLNHSKRPETPQPKVHKVIHGDRAKIQGTKQSTGKQQAYPQLNHRKKPETQQVKIHTKAKYGNLVFEGTAREKRVKHLLSKAPQAPTHKHPVIYRP